MARSSTRLLFKYPVVVVISYLFFHSITAHAACETPIGKFSSLQSAVDLQRNNATDWSAAKLDDKLCEGDTIRVGKNSRAAVQLVNDAVLRLDQNTTMRLIKVSEDEKERSFLEVIKGMFQSLSRDPHHLTIQTPYLNGLIEGTEYLVRVDDNQTSILLLEGKIIAENKQGNVTIAPGQMATANKGEAPKSVLVAKPLDAVHWALHYPALISVDEKAAAAPKDAPSFVNRAAFMLSVGRVDNARKDLDSALALSPGDSNALALQAITYVAQNEQDKALASATQATQSAPSSANALIALSYAQQAKFDLDAARASLEKAVTLEPNNALAWARLAELHSSFRELDKAQAAADKAIAINPNLSRTQTVLGFVSLTKVDVTNAKAAFTKAISLDQTDPLPHLGMGLAMIAEGDLKGGRGELDVAAILDPNQAITRSYLGKAYYEEKRDKLAMQQYEIAKSLDPKDPTPWFYEALAKQAQNQPVDALHSMQQAIDLNDNRAVYRSRLLLDSDLAARSASQARIYSDLGFQQLALVEGWKSSNTDPTNFSAHRFLADSYSALPNHEIARVSELLQSQMLQPLNMTPIQPQLAESNLFLINASGAGSTSFNEFNPLFYRDGASMQFSALTGGNNTDSVEAVLAGVNGNVAYSIGGYHFQSDGFRPNAHQDVDLANAFIQVEVSPDTSIQAEYRYKDAVRGDLQLRFFPDEFFIGQTIPETERSLRIGATHHLSPQSVLLASVIHMDAQYGVVQNPYPPSYLGFGLVSFFGDEPQKSLGAEIQHLYRTSSFNLTSGIGHFDRDSSANTILNTAFPPPDDQFVDTSDTDLKYSNAYVYSKISPVDSLTLTLGLSGEFKGDTSSSSQRTANDDDQYNPKFGLMWNASKDTLVRLAAFRSTKRPVVANQTLEPTQVAGFNQFYDDYNSTVSRRYGAAIDHKLSSDLHGGIEVSRRDLDVPVAGFDVFFNPIYYNVDWEENLSRVYLFWTPESWLGLKMEYQYEKIDRVELTDGVQHAKTQRVLLGMRLFGSSGWSFAIDPTYYDQQGTFESILNPGTFTDGEDSFWVVDSAVSYRLPKRTGIISAGLKNMFDEEFMYFDTNDKNSTLQPGRILFVNATLSLP